jgi:murein DD-endopeptidase MepM/ murein hydrolase activator NlpD
VAAPSPLANLPRPLDERDGSRHRRRVRRLTTFLTTIAVIGGIALAASTLLPLTAAPVGAVQGALATPGPYGRPAPFAGTRPATGSVGVAPVAAGGPRVAPSDKPATDRVAADPHLLAGYRWPLPKGRLTLPFGPSPWGSRVVDGENYHDGIDLATFCGDRIVAAHGGKVLAAGRHYDRVIGWIGDLEPYFARLDRKKLWSTLPIVVVIDDGNGYRSIYAHFGRIRVKKGDTVKAGQLIGYEGATGRASGCHLHYGLFSPDETATFTIDKDVAKRMKLPRHQIARIDPLLVLPSRKKKDPAPIEPSPSTLPSPSAGAS